MLLVISILFSFSQYYSNLITKTYQENSYFLVTSEKDIFDNIKEMGFAIDIENVILLEPNNISFPENQDINNNILVDQGNNLIIVSPNRNQEIKLEDNQVVIELPKFMLNNVSRLSNLTGKKISFKIGDNKKDFEIVKIYESNFARVVVSQNTFKDLVQNSSFYAYTFLLNDYRQKEEIVNYFQSQKNVQLNFIQFYESEAQFNTVQSLENVINLLSSGSIIFVVIFLILFLIITYNVIRDELEKMYIERLLGYNKMQIKKFLIMKIIILDLIVIFFYTISYILVNFLIINIFGIKINAFNFNVIYIVFILFLISIFLCFFAGVKRKKIKKRLKIFLI